MNIINQWSTLICLSSISCVIIEIILPSGKMEKMVRVVLGVFMLSSLIIPFYNGIPKLRSVIGVKYAKNINEYKFLETADKQFQTFASNNLEVIIKSILKDIEIEARKIEISVDTIADDRVPTIKCRIYINKSNEKKMGSIKNYIKERLNIESDVIVN